MNRLSLHSVLCALALIAAAPNSGAAAPSAIAAPIAAQPLISALNEFVTRTGMQVVYRSELAEGVQSKGAVSGVSPEKALEQLLRDTGLRFEFINAGTVAVLAKNEVAGAAQRESTDPLAPIAGMRLVQSEVPSPTDEKSSAEDRKEGEKSKVEEIIVTAQKREEQLKDVPISISVLSGADLDKSTAQGISESLNRVPGVATTISALGNPQVIVRGVTANALLSNGSSTIAYYLDSVPFGFVRSALVPDSAAYDLERVEVLRGPQGTLYGSSALNGVVRILSKDPNLNEFEFKARTAVSTTQGGGENYRGDMAVNVPIIDGKLAARAVVGYQDMSGWIEKLERDNANNGEISNVRLKLYGQPTDTLSVVASAWLSRTDFGAQSIANNNGLNRAAFPEPFSADYDAFGLKIGYDFSGVSLTSMSGYLDYKIQSNLDLGPAGLAAQQTSNYNSAVFSQEIILNSTGEGSWRWSVGGMYRDVDDERLQRISTSPLVQQDYNDLSKSFAVFGEATRLFLDGRLELTAGLRYFEDDVTNRENYNRFGLALIRTNDTFEAVTPRVVLNWHPNTDVTLYASYAEGFRSGFTQLPAVIRSAPQFEPLDSDSLKNYELGAKGTLLQGRLNFDAAVYYIDWQDVQQALAVLVNGIAVNAAINGESASGVGFEFAVTGELLEGLELGVNYSWNDLRMDGNVLSSGVVLFNKGDRLNTSPQYTAGASLEYGFPMGTHGFEGRFTASANFISEQDSRTISGGRQVFGYGDPMLVGRTSFTIDAPNNWAASLFVDNINNERGTPVLPAFNVEDWAARIRPRTYGVQFEFDF